MAAECAEPKTLAVELTAVSFGGTAIVSLPGEVFVEIALAIRAASPFAKTLFLGLANDYIVYVPTPRATAAAGYEVVASRAPGEAGGMLLAAATGLLCSMKAAGAARETSRA